MRSEDVLARAEEALKRHGGRSPLEKRSVQRLLDAGKIKFKRLAWLTAAFLFGVPLFALLVTPLDIGGIILAVMAYFGLSLAALLWPAGVQRVKDDALPSLPLSQLPQSTELWLTDQRRALPPPAQLLVDGIGERLDILGPQLRMIDEKAPAAFEVRRLIADELPELVRGYQRVPAHLRREGRNGMSPDQQLVDGLNVVTSELDRMSLQLASGDLDKLATQGRYLELKYQGDPQG